MTTFQDLLTQPIAFHRIFSKIAGSVTAGVMLSQAFYWSKTKQSGWFYKTQAEWTEETTLTRSEQETARRKLVAVGVLEEKKIGMPAKLFYRVNFEVLESLALQYAEIPQTEMRKPCAQACDIPANLPAEIPQTFKGTENTTEITPEKEIYIAPESDLGLVDENHAEQIENNFIWLRQRKNLKRLPQSEWLGLFTDLEAEGITLDKFQDFYIWVENLDWVTGTVSIKLLTGQIEAYKNREHFEAKRKIKNGSNQANNRKSRTDAEVFQQSADFYNDAANFSN